MTAMIAPKGHSAEPKQTYVSPKQTPLSPKQQEAHRINDSGSRVKWYYQSDEPPVSIMPVATSGNFEGNRVPANHSIRFESTSRHWIMATTGSADGTGSCTCNESRHEIRHGPGNIWATNTCSIHGIGHATVNAHY